MTNGAMVASPVIVSNGMFAVLGYGYERIRLTYRNITCYYHGEIGPGVARSRYAMRP